jgi:hypothetical protein
MMKSHFNSPTVEVYDCRSVEVNCKTSTVGSMCRSVEAVFTRTQNIYTSTLGDPRMTGAPEVFKDFPARFENRRANDVRSKTHTNKGY